MRPKTPASERCRTPKSCCSPAQAEPTRSSCSTSTARCRFLKQCEKSKSSTTFTKLRPEKSSAMNLRKSDTTALREKVIETIVRVLGERYDPNQRDLELTSLQMLELIVALEDEFEIHI